MEAPRPAVCGLYEFIRANLPVAPLATLPGISLHQAGPRSGLGRLADGGQGVSPYWAYPWSGGLALARHFLERPEIVAGRRVLDLGAGSGLVAIAASRAGAAEVIAAETDVTALAAIQLNAVLNGAAVSVVGRDLTDGPPPAVDLVAVGDLFYEHGLALSVTAFLDRCLAAGLEILIGDPGRAFLPVARLRRVAAYAVSGFGDAKEPPFRTGFVFSLCKDMRQSIGPESGTRFLDAQTLEIGRRRQSSFSASSRNASGTGRAGASAVAAKPTESHP